MAGNQVASSDNDDLTIVEPWLLTDKAVNQATGVEAGDTLTYTVTLRNDGTSTAFEVNFNDTLAQGTTFGAVQTARINGIDVSTGTATPNSDGTVITFADPTWDLSPTQALVLTYTVQVTNAVIVDGTHANTVDADWSSLNGNQAGERVYDENDGIDSPVDGGALANRDVDTAVFTVDPVTIDKTNNATAATTIGDTVTYTLTVTSPDGTIQNLRVTDAIPAGITFNAASVTITHNGSSILGNVTQTVTANSVEWIFNPNTAPPLPTETIFSNGQPIVITYTGTVANIVANGNGDTLTNTATLQYTRVDGTDPAITDSSAVQVHEPIIETTKDVSSPADPAVGVLPGETLTYTVRLENSGSSTAYEVTAQDVLPSGVAYVSGSATALYNGNIDATISVDAGTPGILNFASANPGDWDIAPGEYILISYSIVVQGAGYVVGSHTNTVDADWSGQDGNQPSERVYEDQVDADGKPLYGVDGNQDENPAAFVVKSNPPSLGDFVFFDANGDGVQGLYDSNGDSIPDRTEPGIAGVEINLYAPDLTTPDADDYFLLATATTDATGFYQFANLPLTTFSGPYRVEVDPASLPAGLGQVYENPAHNLSGADPDLNNTSYVTVLDPSTGIEDVDFGYRSDGSIGDYVFYDANHNGINDDPGWGIPGAVVTLTADMNGDGAGDFTLVTTTDANGEYRFNFLPYVDYEITVTPPTDLTHQAFDPDGASDNATMVILTPTQHEVLTADFGYVGTGSIGDTIWQNLDGDSVQDAGELGLAGVTVTLTGVDVNGDGTPDTFTTTTLADGSYAFTGLPPGSYTVTVDTSTLPGGATSMSPNFDPDGTPDSTTSATLTLTDPGLPMVRNDIDFGYIGQGTIGNQIWLDLDGDGTQDSGEFGIPGVTVILTGDTNKDGTDESYTQITDATGTYWFTNFPSGPYTVRVDTSTLPGSLIQTGDPDATFDNEASIPLPVNAILDTIDFGYQGLHSIGDTVWLDLDGNGIQDGQEPGLAGIGITLVLDFDNNPSTPNDTLHTTTDASGSYLFGGLPSGQYTVLVDPLTLPGGVNQTADPDGLNDNRAELDLATASDLDQDFGYQGSGSIGDVIWDDTNANGKHDPGEAGLPGVAITLEADIDNDGTPDFTLTTTTDANGGYSFTGLPAGEYTLDVNPATTPTEYIPSGDPDGVLDNHASITLSATDPNSSMIRNDIDFGYTATGSLGDSVWYDFDADGVQDVGEVGLPGVEVTLRGDIDLDGSPDTRTTMTDGNGRYLFDLLPSGSYTITINPATLPGGMAATYDIDGTTSIDQATCTLAVGEDTSVVDFGYTGTGSVGDTVWNDRNRNGVHNPGEPGIGGVSVSIGIDLNGDGAPDFTVTTVTDANGQYLFDHLPAGSHTIRIDPVTLPSAIRPTFDPDGTLDGAFTIRLGAGENNRDVNFGYAYPSPPEKPGGVLVSPPSPVLLPVQPANLEVDAFFLHRQFGGAPQFPFDRWLEINYPMPPLPVAPIYTGLAEPGTTLVLAIYDMNGNQVGSQTIMADTAGNWLASFPGVLLNELPHDMTIDQRISLYNASTAGLFNMRTYFNPGFTSLVTSSINLDVSTIFDYLPTTLMETVHMSNWDCCNIRWNNFNGYEFFAPSINPGRTSH